MFSLGESKGICNEISTDITILGWEVAVAGVVGVHEVGIFGNTQKRH